MTKRKDPKDFKKDGRPTKYDDKYCDMLLDFMSTTSHEVYQDVTYYKDWQVRSETNKILANTYPTFERFSHNIWVHPDTLREWAFWKYPDDYSDESLRWQLKHPKFSEIYKKCQKIQESILIENALNWQYNWPFAMFLAKNKFWYKDKSEVDNNVKVHTVDAILDKITNKPKN